MDAAASDSATPLFGGGFSTPESAVAGRQRLPLPGQRISTHAGSGGAIIPDTTMGIYERDYHRGVRHGHFSGRRMTLVQILIIVNVVVFLFDSILQGSLRGQPLAPLVWGYFSFHKAIADFQIWRLFTYQFIHGGILHLVFNMIGLHFFGPFMETYFGRRRFLAFYLLCGVAGAVVMSALAFVPGLLGAGPFTPLIGASGAIYGVLVGTATLHPDLPVRLLFPPIEMRMKTLVGVSIGIILLSLLAGSQNAGGEACHLGGAILGFLLVRHSDWLGVFDHGLRLPSKPARAKPPASITRVNRADIDRVLDKISREGIHSLTDAEKRILEEARKEL